jgi:solute carrier family 35 protein E3
MTTPCVALIQFVLLGKTISGLTIAALAAVCFGVALTNTGAADTTSLGASIAVAAFTVTAFYQVWIGKKIKDFGVSSPQLLLNQAPISVLLLAFVAPFFDTIPDVSTVPTDAIIALFLSGLAAALLVCFRLIMQTNYTNSSAEPVTVPNHRKDERSHVQRRIKVSRLDW